MSTDLQKKIESAISDLQVLSNWIADYGTEIRYEVEWVGGTRPVDAPHTSAPFLAEYADKSMKALIRSSEFDRLLVTAEEAIADYEEEYDSVRRDLDLEPAK